MTFTVIIPARYQSTRLPGKPLLKIGDKPMIHHVYLQATASDAGQVMIATDDQRIEQTALEFGATVIMTDANHTSGTDRLAEAAEQLGLGDDEIIVNVQGDEPFIPPVIINQVANNLSLHPEASVATLCSTIEENEAFQNPNIVKVVQDKQGMAHYFSRAAIPYYRDKTNSLPHAHCFRHIGIYAYRVSALKQFVTWPSAPIEEIERLEQLRFLWNGHKIHVAIAAANPPVGVDTEEDLKKLRDGFKK